MSRIPTNESWKRQQKMLTPAAFKKAVVAAVNVQNNTADVYFIENPETVIRSVPLSSAITASTLVAGTKCRVDLFDEKNSRDMVVAYTYSGAL